MEGLLRSRTEFKKMGHLAMLAGVPRCACPYTGAPARWWLRGWDDTGFVRHIDIPVHAKDERPESADVARTMIGSNAREIWVNVTGLGYEKHWLWILGI